MKKDYIVVGVISSIFGLISFYILENIIRIYRTFRSMVWGIELETFIFELENTIKPCIYKSILLLIAGIILYLLLAIVFVFRI